ncbi:MAG TPA: hypothetical protein VF398_00380 [bacterium]
MKRITIAALLAIAIILPQIVLSQPPEEKRHPRERRRDQIEGRIHTMKIWKLTDELQLSEEQATRFFPLMNQFDRQQDTIEVRRRDTLGRLGEIVWDPNPDPKVINQMLDDLESFGEEQAKLRKKFRQDVSDVLKPDQLGKLAVFNARFPEMIRGMVRELDEEKGAPGLPPPRKGGDW